MEAMTVPAETNPSSLNSKRRVRPRFGLAPWLLVLASRSVTALPSALF